MGKYAMLIKNKDGKYLIINYIYFLAVTDDLGKSFRYTSFFEYITQHYTSYYTKKDIIKDAFNYLGAVKAVKDYKEGEAKFNKCLKPDKRETATCQIISIEKACQMADDSLNIVLVPTGKKRVNYYKEHYLPHRRDKSIEARRYDKNRSEEIKKLKYHNL